MDRGETYHIPAADEVQLSFRAVAVGCLVGSVVSCTNIYIGLKIGWTFGASIISAVLGFAAFSLTHRRLSVLETNIAQTAGSAAGSMAPAAGLVAAIPAMAMLGHTIPWPSLMLWSLAIAFLGVFFAVPLRRQMVEVEKLRFPTGTATAETIMAMHGEAAAALAKARVLLWSGIVAGAFTLAYHFVPQLESPPLEQWIGWSGLAIAATWTFKLYLGPSLLGAGFLIGPRVVLSLVLGAVVAWGVLGPLAQQQGWAPGEVMSYNDGPRGWLLWPGVALMVCEALTAVALSWQTFVRALRGVPASGALPSPDDTQIPRSWWLGGLVLGSLLTIVLAHVVFGIAWYLSIVAIGLSFVLSIVAVRSVGETDINPIGGMGKVTQLVFGLLSPGQMTSNLMSAAITGAGASQAADMMQDLRTGYLLGASPRKQLVAQLVGICTGVVFVVPVYEVFARAYEFGGEKLPAPAALAWKAMAELLAQGTSALPPYCLPAVLVAGAVGIALACLRQVKRWRGGVPSGLAIGIAFIIPAYYSLVIFWGLVGWWAWRRLSPVSVERYDFAVASGLIAGEGLMGIVNALLTIAGIEPLT
jgi:uncharacterized oligopeptide transporter (OPT) family protein